MKYRKIQAEIEAFQMTAAAANQNPRFNWPDWMVEAYERHAGSKGAIWADVLPEPKLMLGAADGVVEINENDWIIRGETGLHLMPGDVFAKLYEPVAIDLVDCIGEVADA